MSSETNTDALRSTLDELTHLLINPSRLNILSTSEIGSGGYGEVYLATLDGMSRVASKQLRLVQAEGSRTRAAIRLARELKVWAKTKHPNVLELVGYYLSESYVCAQLISPYMENGNITQYLKRTQATIETRLSFVQGITLGMAYLHSCDPPICHGDLKPANVLISDRPDAVLCDFGLASFIMDSGVASGLTTSRSIKGSLRYMSPELFNNVDAKHTLESDIWAWACTIFESITDCRPYATCLSDGSVMVAVVQGGSPGSTGLFDGPASKVNMSSRSMLLALQSLIQECWSIDARERPPASSILKRLKYLGFGNTDLPPAQPLHDEQTDDSVSNEPTATEIFVLSQHQITQGLGYESMSLATKSVNGWVAQAPPLPEMVLRFHEDGYCIAMAPDEKWLAADVSGVGKLWNMENISAPPLCLPGRYPRARYEWSSDSRYLACFGFDALYIWSTESQSSVGQFYETSRPVRSVAWFSNGEALAVYSTGCISTMISNSGQFQMASDWIPLTSRTESAAPMAAIPSHCVRGQRIVVIFRRGQQVGPARHGWFLDTILSYTRPDLNTGGEIIVYDTDTRRILAQAPHDDSARNVTVSGNGEFALLSHPYTPPTLWRLNITDRDDGIWSVQINLTHSFSMPRLTPPITSVYWARFGGDNDEWVISATEGPLGAIVIWNTQSPDSTQIIRKIPRFSDRSEVGYFPAKDNREPLVLLYKKSVREVVIWKWWKVPSNAFGVDTAFGAST